MPSNRYCHFCGRSDSLHAIPETTKWVCSLCWEIIVYVVGKFIQVLASEAIPTRDEIVLQFLRDKLEEKHEQPDKL